jgi:hypothetical protein
MSTPSMPMPTFNRSPDFICKHANAHTLRLRTHTVCACARARGSGTIRNEFHFRPHAFVNALITDDFPPLSLPSSPPGSCICTYMMYVCVHVRVRGVCTYKYVCACMCDSMYVCMFATTTTTTTTTTLRIETDTSEATANCCGDPDPAHISLEDYETNHRCVPNLSNTVSVSVCLCVSANGVVWDWN